MKKDETRWAILNIMNSFKTNYIKNMDAVTIADLILISGKLLDFIKYTSSVKIPCLTTPSVSLV